MLVLFDMTLNDYLDELELQHKRPNTIKDIKSVLYRLDNWKPLDECGETDIKDYIKFYIKKFKDKHGREPQFSTLNTMYGIIKKYYVTRGRLDIVHWMHIKNHMKKLNPNDLLEKSEIQKMLLVTDNTRNKCLLALVYDTGMRIGEALSIKKNDVKFLDGECRIRIPDNHEGEQINSKTGSRMLVVIESIPYIENYLNIHNGDERLFPIKRSRADEILKELAKKAGINKRVYWHLIRHSRATEMAKLGMQETSMKKRFGWTESSNMIERYTSLTDDDADNAYKIALGFGVDKKNTVINPIALRCSKCGKLIETGSYCPQCEEIESMNHQLSKQRIQNEALVTELDQIKSLLVGLMDHEDKGYLTGRVKDEVYNAGLLKSSFGVDEERHQKQRDEEIKYKINDQ